MGKCFTDLLECKRRVKELEERLNQLNPPKPDWVTQAREEVAEEELYAASIHYTYMALLEEGHTEYLPYGDHEWHERWWQKHQEAAWYTAPKYTEERLGGKT